MSAYEEILKLMRSEGKKENTMPIQIGVMIDQSVCAIGNLKLSKEDFLVGEHLKTGYFYKIHEEQPSKKDESSFIEGLKKGDKVAVYRISDDCYIILERLVEL